MKRKEIIDLFLRTAFIEGKRFPVGRSCTYIQLNDELGVKCYIHDPVNRNHSFKTQKKLYKLKLAPKAHFKFDFRIPFFKPGKRKCYQINCFVTQHAEKCGGEYLKQLPELYAALQQNGMSTHDIAQRNCGLINNKLIIIDCDWNST